jgi:hypothetical protein
VSVATKANTVAYRSDLDVNAFAVSARGDRIVVTGEIPQPARPSRFASKRGVLVKPDDHLLGLGLQRLTPARPPTIREVRVVEPGREGTAATSVTLYRSPREQEHPEGVSMLSMSPDGRRVALAVHSTAGVPVPDAWKRDAIYPWLTPVLLLELPARLADARPAPDPAGSAMQWPYRLAYDAPLISKLEWSDDGASVLIQAPTPVGDGVAVSTDREKRENELGASRQRLYAMDVATGAIAIVQESARTRDSVRVLDALVESIIAFDHKGSRVVLKHSNGEIVTLRRPAGADRTATWIEERRIKTDVAGYRKSEATTVGNDRLVVGVNQDLMVPPDLYVLDLASGKKTILTEINPELKTQRLGRVEKLLWKDSSGTNHRGYIVYPVDYTPGTRYPAAILHKSWDDSFVHGGQVYRSNFPPQALAGSNIVVFMLANAYGPGGWNTPQGSNVHRAFESARQQLVDGGLIDPAKVGVMGFSFTSWEVDFLISHPGRGEPWAAAVSADGGLGHYAAAMQGRPKEIRADADGIAGVDSYGMPFGDGLKTWLQLSPGFNAQHVRTPLLQQWHGNSLWSAAEFHNALYGQGKPVEMFWFPGGIHILQFPSEREASYQQVVDWFRFWLQDYERPSVAEDPERYARWRALRTQHEQNEQWIKTGKNPVMEFRNRVADR